MRHRGSRVARAGWYGEEGRLRQRWWCYPKSGEPHRFTEPLPRLVTAKKLVHECPTCHTTLEPWEGRPAPRLYGFAVEDVAWALAQVAAGSSYRSVADRVRTRAGRQLERSWTVTTTGKGKNKKTVRHPPPNTHAQVVCDWAEVFAPVLWAAYAPRSWPSAVVLDADPVTYSRRSKGAVTSFTTLAVIGYDDATHRSYVAGVEAVPTYSATAWKRLLSSKPGAPTWVVTDGGKPEIKGVAGAWKRAETWRCEWHLGKNLSDPYPDWLASNRTHPLWAKLAAAQTSPAAWRAYRRALADLHTAGQPGLRGALAAAERLDQLISAQAAARPITDDHLPRSVGAVEDFHRHVSLVLAGRAATMTNKARADALLMLLAMSRNGWVDEKRWTQLLTEHLLDHKTVPDRGRPARLQRSRVDERATPSLPKK